MPLQSDLYVLLTCTHYSLSTSLLSGTTGYSRLILYFFFPIPGIHHFFKNPFSGERCLKNTDLDSRWVHCYYGFSGHKGEKYLSLSTYLSIIYLSMYLSIDLLLYLSAIISVCGRQPQDWPLNNPYLLVFKFSESFPLKSKVDIVTHF